LKKNLEGDSIEGAFFKLFQCLRRLYDYSESTSFSKELPMNSHVRHLILALMACCVASAAGATLFSDDFQDANASNAKWAYPGAITQTVTNGAATLINTDTTYLWFATHNMGSKAATFTLSATITLTSPASNGVGIACCLDANNFIAVQVGTGQNLFVYKYESNVVQLLSVTNSFITTAVNTIKVSKRDSTFNVFCNGAFITTFFVSAAKFIGGGDIGMLLPAKAQATYDDIRVTDQFETGASSQCFSDNFSNANLIGWYTGTLVGQAQISGQALTLTNTDAINTSMPFVNGRFDQASYRVIAAYKTGGKPYGLAIIFPTQVSGGIAYKPYSFLVDSLRRYGYGKPLDSTIKLSAPKTFIHSSTGDGKDTLEVLRFAGKYKFRINGTIVEDSLPLNGSVVSAGLFVSPQTSVSFDDFMIGGDSTGASVCAVIAHAKKSDRPWNPGISFSGSDYLLFDLTGRLVKRMGSNSTATPLAAPGLFVIRAEGKPYRLIKAAARIYN